MPGEEGFALPPFEEANQPRTPLTLEEAGISEQTDEP
jgi:hypothetical protein